MGHSPEYHPGGPGTRLPRAQSRWLMQLARLARLPMALAVAAPLLAGALLLAQAALLARVLDRAIVGGVPREALVGDIVAIVALMLVRAGLVRLGEGAGAAAAERIKRTLREALFAAFLAHKTDWMRQQRSGELANLLVDQIDGLDGFFARFLPAMIAAAILPLAFAVAVLPVEPVVGALFLLTAPLIPLFMALAGWGAEAASRRHLDAFARLSGLFADRLRGLLTLKLFGRAEAEIATVQAASSTLHRSTMAVLRIAFLSSAVLEFFAALGVAGVALYVGLTYLDLVDLRAAPLTLQAGLFCLLMAPEVYLPLRQLAAHYHDRAAARAAVALLADTLPVLPDLDVDAPAGTATPAPALPVMPPAAPAAAATLDIAALTVAPPQRAAAVLDGASLHLGAGSHVALIGDSGIGKSTLLEAVARLRDHGGSIRLDGVALDALDEDTLRRRVAFLPQRPRLFAGSIADNIRLGLPGATDAAVAHAARVAGVADFADCLPAGLDTAVGERGLGLSGGEAQRVALARIFLRDPGLILLDEPTAHLDAACEAAILDAICAFAAGRTLLIATHSPAVAARMDRVLRIAGGQILPVPHRRPAPPPRALPLPNHA